MMHIKIKDGHPKTFLVNSFQNGDPHRVEITKTHGPFRCGMMPRRPEQTEGLLSASGMRHGIHGTPSRSKSMMIDTLVAWGILIKSVFLSRNRIVVSKPMGPKNGFPWSQSGGMPFKGNFCLFAQSGSTAQDALGTLWVSGGSIGGTLLIINKNDGITHGSHSGTHFRHSPTKMEFSAKGMQVIFLLEVPSH